MIADEQFFISHLAQKNAYGLGITLRDYAIVMRKENHLAAAHRARELARELAQVANDIDGLALSHLALLSGYNEAGRGEMVLAAYQSFKERPPKRGTLFWLAKAKEYFINQSFDWRLSAGESLSKDDQDALRTPFAELQEKVVGDWYDESPSRYCQSARAMLSVGQQEKAKEFALKAYELAWADGSPYVWWKWLEDAKQILAALHIPYPELPPFDPVKVEKIPHEDEIHGFIEELKAKNAQEGETAGE